MAVFTLTEGSDLFPTAQDVSGDDQIYALGGDDLLSGGAGADKIDGGEGFDTVSYAAALAPVFVGAESRVPRNDGTGDTFVSIERVLLSAYGDLFRFHGFTTGVEIDGGGGDDRVTGSNHDDLLRGGEGNDDLRGGEGSDEIDGGDGNDLVDGGGGQDVLRCGAGDDLIQSGTNSDEVDGGDGFDTMILYGDASQYALTLRADGAVAIFRKTPEYEQSGTVTVNGSTDSVRGVEQLRYYSGEVFDLSAWIAANAPPPGFGELIGTAGADVLAGGEGMDAIYGLGGDDSLSGLGGGDLLSGGWGADAFDGGEGVDTVTYANASGAVRVNDQPLSFFGEPVATDESTGDSFVSVEIIELSAFDDTFRWVAETAIAASGGIGMDRIAGGAAADTLDGGEGDDVVAGGGGNDTLLGGAGKDRLDGGDGDDLIDGGAGADAIYGGAGYDVVTLAGRTAAVAIGTSAGEGDYYESIEEYRLTEFDDFIRVPVSHGNEDGTPLASVFAGAGDDHVEGGTLAGRLYGEEGNDTIIAAHWGSSVDGGAGDDVIRSGYGADTIEGGDGTDIVHFRYARDEYLIERDGDAIIVSHPGSGWTDRLTGVETLVFPHPMYDEEVVVDVSTIGAEPVAEIMVGEDGADVLVSKSLAQSARIFGLGGADRMAGGAQDDVLNGGDGRDVLRLEAGGDDRAYGGGDVDSFYFGAAFTAADMVDGGDDRDSILLQGNYKVAFGSEGKSNIAGVESISLLSGGNAAYGDTAGNRYDYDLTLLDANVAAGALMKLNGFHLQPGEDFTLDASAETDASLQILAGLGVDRLTGGAMGDVFVFGHDGRFGAGDRVEGGGGYDVLYLRGDYVIDFNAAGYSGSLSSVESIGLLTSANTEFAGGGDGEFDYVITWNDAMLANGVNMSVNGSRLGANESFVFDGSSETGGNLRVFGGAAADTLTTGGGNDILYGGGGADVLTSGAGIDIFRYQAVSDSTAAAKDTIHGFAKGSDRIDVARIDADAGTAADEAFAFIGSNAFTAAGQLRAFNVSGDLWQVEGDVNGDGTADLVIQVHVEAGQPLGAADFQL